jgi:hypothetical protein
VGELKHLSTLRKKNNSRSSGERNGTCLNPIRVKLTGVADRGLRADIACAVNHAPDAALLHELPGTADRSG